MVGEVRSGTGVLAAVQLERAVLADDPGIAVRVALAVDLTGVRLKRSTVGMGTSYGLRLGRRRLPSGEPRPVS